MNLEIAQVIYNKFGCLGLDWEDAVDLGSYAEDVILCSDVIQELGE